MYTNPSLTGEENLCILLSHRLQRPVTPEDIAIGYPQETVKLTEEQNGANTEVDVTAKPDSGLSGHLTLRYQRLDLKTLLGENPYHLTVSDTTTLEGLHLALTNHFSLRDTDVTLSLTTLPVITAPTECKLVANHASLLYTRYLDIVLHPPQ